MAEVYQEQQQYQEGYEFQANPQAQQQQAKYRDPQEYGEDQYDSEDYQDENPMYWEQLEYDQEDETQLIPDYYVDKPPTPEFRPLPRGTDVGTQINDRELFDFEIEVVPVLQVLVGRTMKQARMELIEESERKDLSVHKSHYIKKRNAELMVTQRMENAFLRRKEERERRDQQHKLRLDQNKIAHKKLISLNMTKRVLSKMKENALNDLEDIGYLKATTEQNIKTTYIPWLIENAVKKILTSSNCGSALTSAMSQFQQNQEDEHLSFIEKEMQKRKNELARRQREKELKEERKRKKLEWKRKMGLQAERAQMHDSLYQQVIIPEQKIANIWEAQITDILGDNQTTPIMGVYGGLLGQLWILLGAVNQLIVDENLQLSEEQLSEFILNLLNNKLTNPVVIKINKEQQEIIQQNIKLMEDDLVKFNEQKEQFIQSLLDNPDIYTDFPTLNNIKLNNTVPVHVFKQILKNLLQIYFTSYDFKDPVEQKEQQGEENQGEDQSQAKEPESQQQSVQRSQDLTPQEQQIVDAKKKIQLDFDSQEQFNNIKAFLRLRIPFLTEEEILREKEEELERQRQEQGLQSPDGQPQENVESEKPQKQNQLEEEEKSVKELTKEEREAQRYAKYDEFVDTFNGEEYVQRLAKNQEISRRRDISQEQSAQYTAPSNNSAIVDERAEQHLRRAFYFLLKEQFPERFEEITEQQFVDKCFEISEKSQENYLQKIPKIEDIAVFDIDQQQTQ